MVIERNVLRIAMVQIYLAIRTGSTAGVSSRSLEGLWAERGFRRSDFTVALQQMQLRKWIEEAHVGSEKYLFLTTTGIQECRKLRNDLFTRFQDWVTLLRFEWRGLKIRMAQERVRHRRSYD